MLLYMNAFCMDVSHGKLWNLCVYVPNTHTPQFPTPLALAALALLVEVAPTPLELVPVLPFRPVPLRSQLPSAVLPHTALGIVPFRFEFPVRDNVVSAAGREVGGDVKALFWRYLRVSVVTPDHRGAR